jgi:hypothetical protein
MGALTYVQTITFNANLSPGLKTADFIYITDDGRKIYVPGQSNTVLIYDYKGANKNPLYQLSPIPSPIATSAIFSIVANKQGTVIYLGQKKII